MIPKKRGAAVAGLAVGIVLAVSACQGATSGATSSPAKAGGTLYMLNVGPVLTWDPQRNYSSADGNFAGSTVARTLTTFIPGSGPTAEGKLAADLATNTGTMTDEGKTWTFELRDDAKWQDGKPVTCADVKYGVSRTFATDQITGGPTYAIDYLAIPKNAKGQSTFAGPYAKTGQDLYDKAVTCNGAVITFHLNRPVTDFNQAVTVGAFSAYRQDKDTGAKGTYSAFSDGPYMLQGSWTTEKGGTFIRNPYWTAASDPIRKAYPDSIVYQEGLDAATITQRIMSDSGNDKFAVTTATAPSALQAQIVTSPQIKDRSSNPASVFVDYLVPNFKSKVMGNAKARQAFAMATNRDAYVTAHGGPSAMTPTFSILNKAMPAYQDFNPFGSPSNGDDAAAKKVLESSGLTLPVPITVTYRKDPTSDKAFAALEQSWQTAGFNVTLKGISQQYYAALASPDMATQSDVFWSDFGDAWPSGSTMIPQLFDSRINLSEAGPSNDTGYFDNAAVNAQMDVASNIVDPAAREKAWGALAETIAKDGGYVALANEKFLFVHGSSVKNYRDSATGLVDLNEIAVS